MIGHGSLKGYSGSIHNLGKANLPKIEFPKVEFSLRDVHHYRDNKLQYPKSYNLYETKLNYVLEFDKKLHDHHYGTYTRTNAYGHVKFGSNGMDDPRKYIRR